MTNNLSSTSPGCSLLLLSVLCISSFFLGYYNADIKVSDASEFSHWCKDPSAMSKEWLVGAHEKFLTRVLNDLSSAQNKSILLPATLSNYATGMIRVTKAPLMETYDMGVPFTPKNDKNSEALIIYNHPLSLPSDVNLRHDVLFGNVGSFSALDTNSSSALANCDTLNILFLDSGHTKVGSKFNECVTIIGDVQSYHKTRWIRSRTPSKIEDNTWEFKTTELNSSLPLRHVGRLVSEHSSMDEYALPLNKVYQKKGDSYLHFQALRKFLENVDKVLGELKEIVDPLLKENTVVVLTVNNGQSVLLSNFVCSAKSRGLDIGNVLVFPTDKESHLLAQGLGLATYHDESSFSHLPKSEAQYYGDATFGAMMFAKILCVLYINLLGHDVLFQDVDVVWYKDPLKFFHGSTTVQNYDIMLQHDGSPQPRFAPYSANSGFYYVRCNSRTTYLFISFLYNGGLVSFNKSHQQVMIELLLEHSSMFGLKVKVFDKVETDEFPGGFHFHRDFNFMKKLMNGSSNAYAFHMSWTENKSNKLLFLRQMGNWYVKDRCVGSDFNNTLDDVVFKRGVLLDFCCSSDALISCHYRDKPSKVPCLDSPPIDANGPSFWH